MSKSRTDRIPTSAPLPERDWWKRARDVLLPLYDASKPERGWLMSLGKYRTPSFHHMTTLRDMLRENGIADVD